MTTLLTAVVVALVVAVAVLGVLVYGLLRSHALILKSLHDLGADLELEREPRPTLPTPHTPTRVRRPAAPPRSAWATAWSPAPAAAGPRHTTSSAPTSPAATRPCWCAHPAAATCSPSSPPAAASV